MRPNSELQKDKKNRIIEAAAQVFAQKGYAGAAVADIADEAEIGKGTIYGYFDSKEDLFFAVFEWFMMQTGAAAKVSISHLGGSAAQRLEALSDSIMGMWDEIKDVFTLTIEFWAASSSLKCGIGLKMLFAGLYEEFQSDCGICHPRRYRTRGVSIGCQCGIRCGCSGRNLGCPVSAGLV